MNLTEGMNLRKIAPHQVPEFMVRVVPEVKRAGPGAARVVRAGNEKQTLWSELAPEIFQKGIRIGNVFQRLERDNYVKRRIRGFPGGCIADAKLQARGLVVSAGESNGRGVGIDSHDLSRAQNFQHIGTIAGAAGGIQNALAPAEAGSKQISRKMFG